MKLITLALLLLLPSLASAQTTPIVVGNILDIASTEVMLRRPNTYEANPILSNHMAQRLAVKSLSTAAQVYLVKKLEKSHPRLARGLGWTLGAIPAVVAVKNGRQR